MGTLAHVQIGEESLADASEAIPTPPTQPYFLQASVPLLRCNIPRIQAFLLSPMALITIRNCLSLERSSCWVPGCYFVASLPGKLLERRELIHIPAHLSQLWIPGLVGGLEKNLR